MSIPLCRCRVLYIGSSVPTITKDGLQGIQQPLHERYPVSGEPDTKGIDSWLSVYSNGLLLEYIDGPNRTETAFFPITTLHYCAAVRYVNLGPFNIEGGGGEKFIPLDSPFADIPNSPHPPIFAGIFRRTSGIKVLECHAFICTNEKAANALVRCCFHSYADTIYLKMDDRIPGLKAIKDKSRSTSPSGNNNIEERNVDENQLVSETASKLVVSDTDMWNEVEGKPKVINKRQLSSNFGGQELETPKSEKKNKNKKEKKNNNKKDLNDCPSISTPEHFPPYPGMLSSPRGVSHMPPPHFMPFFPPPPPLPPHHMGGGNRIKFMPPPPGMFFPPPPPFHPMYYGPVPPAHPYYMDRPPTPPMVIPSNQGTGPIIESYYDTFPRRHVVEGEPIYMSGTNTGYQIYGTVPHHQIYSDRNEIYYETYKRQKKPESKYDESQVETVVNGKGNNEEASKFWDQYESSIYKKVHANEKAFMETISGEDKLNNVSSSTQTPNQGRRGLINNGKEDIIIEKISKPPTPPIDYERNTPSPIVEGKKIGGDNNGRINNQREAVIY
uniref:PID domain-containing protein n=1 Tax=Parastrongyloides trichosuri TaxID=131310 RepID=A0A0N4Z713_PARTI